MFKSLIQRYIDYTEKSGFGMKQKLLFFRELWYLLGGGVGINEAINVIASNGDTAAQRYIGANIAVSINEWKTLTNAMTRLSTYFSPSDIAVIKAGDTSGNLVSVLRSLAQEYVFINSISNKFISAITYPVVLLIIAIIAVIVLFVGILPGIFSIATQFPGVALPAVTRAMMAFSDFLQHNVGNMCIGFGLLIFLFSIIFSSVSWRARMFRIALEVPWFGLLIRNYYLVKMMRYFKLLHKSGMNYVDIITLLHAIMGVGPYQDMLENMLSHVQRGEQMHLWIMPYPYLVPANATILLKVGEQTAQVPETLQNIVCHCEVF